MSRLLIAASFIAAFTSVASASFDRPRFAQPPPATAHTSAPARVSTTTPVMAPDVDAPTVLDRAKVRAKLAANRAANLARFRAYQRAGVFPSNTYTDDKLNVW